MGLRKTEQREYAKLLFISQGLTQKEIAERCEVTEKTVSRWNKEDRWEDLKRSLMVVKDQQLTSLYMKLERLNQNIEDKQDNLVTSKDVDAISKLTASIKQLETDTSVGEIISVAKMIINLIQQDDLDFAKELSKYFDLLIKSKL